MFLTALGLSQIQVYIYLDVFFKIITHDYSQLTGVQCIDAHNKYNKLTKL